MPLLKDKEEVIDSPSKKLCEDMIGLSMLDDPHTLEMM